MSGKKGAQSALVQWNEDRRDGAGRNLVKRKKSGTQLLKMCQGCLYRSCHNSAPFGVHNAVQRAFREPLHSGRLEAADGTVRHPARPALHHLSRAREAAAGRIP